MNARAIFAGSLALPLVALAGVWAGTHVRAQQGQDWLVPVTGYDPRDLLRGHYVQYRYDWPARSVEASRNMGYATSLCLIGRAPHIAQVIADPAPGIHCAARVRATMGTRREVQGLDTGILYVSQPRAIILSKQLADPKRQGLLRMRIRPDGVIRPVDMEFRPR